MISQKKKKSRSKLEIYTAILKFCLNNLPYKTKIMQKCNLSGHWYKEYIYKLEMRGMLERVEKRKFKTTEKGKMFISLYEKLSGLLEEGKL